MKFGASWNKSGCNTRQARPALVLDEAQRPAETTVVHLEVIHAGLQACHTNLQRRNTVQNFVALRYQTAGQIHNAVTHVANTVGSPDQNMEAV